MDILRINRGIHYLNLRIIGRVDCTVKMSSFYHIIVRNTAFSGNFLKLLGNPEPTKTARATILLFISEKIDIERAKKVEKLYATGMETNIFKMIMLSADVYLFQSNLHFDPFHFDAPRLGGFVQQHLHVLWYGVPVAEDLVKRSGAQHVPQRGLGQQPSGLMCVGHVSYRYGRIAHSVIDDSVHGHRHTVFCQHLLQYGIGVEKKLTSVSQMCIRYTGVFSIVFKRVLLRRKHRLFGGFLFYLYFR